MFETLKALFKPAPAAPRPAPRMALRLAQRSPARAHPACAALEGNAYCGHAYLSMALTCMEAIHLMTDLTSMETASAAITELVRRGISLESMDWLLIEQCQDPEGKPIPTLAQVQAAYRDRLVALGFLAPAQASVHQAIA